MHRRGNRRRYENRARSARFGPDYEPEHLRARFGGYPGGGGSGRRGSQQQFDVSGNPEAAPYDDRGYHVSREFDSVGYRGSPAHAAPRGFDEEQEPDRPGAAPARSGRRAAFGGAGTESSRDDFHGPYAGRGPAGYRRSDERICEEICEALTQHSHVDASRIQVQVESGEVTLSGSVASRAEKRLAEDLAEAASGVGEVRNELRVQSHAPESTSQEGDAAGQQRT